MSNRAGLAAISAGRRTRSRTGAGFRGGHPWKWTLCNEIRLGEG